MSILFLVCCIGLIIYSTILSGVASESKYSILGGIRAARQTISYEVILTIILFSMILINNRTHLIKIFNLITSIIFFL